MKIKMTKKEAKRIIENDESVAFRVNKEGGNYIQGQTYLMGETQHRAEVIRIQTLYRCLDDFSCFVGEPGLKTQGIIPVLEIIYFNILCF
jgi:hypothetical protein